MPIILYRVDDRLIHGQVVVGWGAQLRLDYLVVVDDELAENEWEQDLYRAGLPERMEARFLGIEAASAEIPKWDRASERGLVLTRDIRTMRRLVERDVLNGQEINLGGLHDAPGRRRVLPYIFLDDGDRGELARLERTGVRVSARDVPGARRVGLEELLRLRPD